MHVSWISLALGDRIYDVFTDDLHLDGQALWVLPAYRNLGAAGVAMEFFLQEVDMLGLECFLEGSAIGTPVYLKCGFVPIVKPVMVFTPPKEPSQDWFQLVRSLHAETITIMWRPTQGIYVEGSTVLPWEGKPRKLKL
jgi:GNAT superfamily N-acetyltransferase